MATANRGVMVYLPLELEEKVFEFCTDRQIVRKDKDGNIVPSLGSGIVAYLKSHLLGDLPSTRRRQMVSTGITKEEVLNLIAESNTSNDLSNRLADEDLVHRLDTILQGRGFANEQSLSSSTGLEGDEVERLIKESERGIMEAVRRMWAELSDEITAIKAIERIHPLSSISTLSQEKVTGDDSTPSVKTVKRDRSLSYVTRFRKLAQNWSAEDIVKIEEIVFSADKKFISRYRLIELTKFNIGIQNESEELSCKPYGEKDFSRIRTSLVAVLDEIVGVGEAPAFAEVDRND